jgi:uncharacterized membrane protein YdjX (TVP38/TMEM64 family)
VSERAGRGRWLKPALFLAILVGGLVAIRNTSLSQYLSYEAFGALIDSYGVVAPLVFLAVYTIAPLFMVPGSLLTLAGAAVFGLGLGFVLILLGSNLGAILAFVVGRWAGRDVIEPRLERAPAIVRKLKGALEERGFYTIFVLRLILTPYNILNYVASLTRISFRDYALGTFLGMLPATFVFVFLGDVLGRAWREGDWGALWTGRTAVAAALFLACLAVPIIYSRYTRKRAGGR